MIGTTLDNRYRLDAELGRGGMAVVYRAHDTLLEREVAVKVLSATALGTEGRAHMLREARAAASLNHPNIVSVYDVAETVDNPFIVMEFVAGKTLDAQRSVNVDEIIAVTRQLCAALDHAHTRGVVHRDLKPENVLLASDGTAKLTDFGLARPMASRLTSEGTIAGTVFYLAPELALGQPFDGRADLYALGVLLYELTTGQLPFTADDPLAVISQHLHAPVVPPRARNADIPPVLDALILRLLEKDPADRPESAGEILRLLDAPDLLDHTVAPERELSVLERIERGRMVGRERELREARALWNQVLSGQGQVLLISGEAGVGKTRLARELVTQVRVSGGGALVGACYAEGGAPYAPFARMLRRALENGVGDDLCGSEELTGVLPEFVLADLLVLAPSLRLCFPDVKLNPPLGDPRAEQHRLAESMVLFVTALSERVPLLLVVEDAQWADSGTLFLLRHLARRVGRRRVMLVATYRELDLDEARPLHEVLLDLQRERLSARMKLPRLNRDGTREMLAVLFAEGITPEFLDGIYRETEGNPFFIEEVCKALVESGEVYFRDGRWHRPADMAELGIPRSVRVAIQSRLGVLPAEAQRTLRLAAVMGREFGLEILAAASDDDEDALFEALESAERAQLIEEVSGEAAGIFAFVHGLIASTLVETTRALQRRRLHRRAATAIEALHPGDVEALAYHWERAEEPGKAGEYMFKAGQRAARQYANQEALDYFHGALERAETAETIHRILAQRARILLDQYRGEEAAGDYERLLESAREAGERRAELDVLLGLAKAYAIAALDARDSDHVSRSHELCGAAYQLAHELDDKASMVRALITTQSLPNFWPEYAAQAKANIREALALSQEITDEELTIDSRMAWIGYLTPPERVEQMRALLSTLESRRDLPRLKEAHYGLMWAHLRCGDFQDCVDCCDAGIRLAGEIGVPPVQYPTLKALALMNLGRYDAAWEALQAEVASEGHHFGRAQQGVGIGFYFLELMAYERAAATFQRVDQQARRVKRPWLRGWAQEGLVKSLTHTGELDEARLEKINQDLESVGLELAAYILDDIALKPQAYILGEIALYQGRPDTALQQAQIACSEVENDGRRPDYVLALELQLRALLRLDRPQDVLSLADRGIQMAEEMGYRPLLWRLHAAKAEAFEMLGQAEAAAQAYRKSANIVRRLADTVPDPELKAGFLADPYVSSIIVAAERSSDQEET